MGSLLFCDFVSIIKLVQQVKITPSTILGDLEGKKEKKENYIQSVYVEFQYVYQYSLPPFLPLIYWDEQGSILLIDTGSFKSGWNYSLH